MILRRYQVVFRDFKNRKTQGAPNPEQFVMLEQWATLLHPFLPANAAAIPLITSKLCHARPAHGTPAPRPGTNLKRREPTVPHRFAINEGEAEPATNLQLGPTRAKQGEFSERTEGSGVAPIERRPESPIPSRPPCCVTDAERRRTGLESQ